MCHLMLTWEVTGFPAQLVPILEGECALLTLSTSPGLSSLRVGNGLTLSPFPSQKSQASTVSSPSSAVWKVWCWTDSMSNWELLQSIYMGPKQRALHKAWPNYWALLAMLVLWLFFLIWKGHLNWQVSLSFWRSWLGEESRVIIWLIPGIPLEFFC